tara:strand:- start:564 stop:1049 length:486 start_codon:yes stop_codon:yes gene_type:complete
MPEIKVSFYLKFVFLISLIALFLAYFIEYILGHQPCNLCLIERIPYVLSLLVVFINYRFKKIEKYLIFFLTVIFFFSLIVSIYHFGIEQGFFQESIICEVKNGNKILSKEEILKELQRRTISCRDVTFRIFGFSLTTINIVISLILLIFSIKIFNSYEKKK